MRGTATSEAKTAVFFDVDGTLADTNIVHYYVYFRRRRFSRLWFGMWSAAFAIKCVYYLLLDKIDRTRFNTVFYRNYAGLSTAQIKGQALDCYRDVIKPREFEQTAACLQEHRNAGRKIVLVSGSIDFILEPLANALAVDNVVAPSLVEENGRFTGELDGPPIGQKEKARRMGEFALEHGIDLSQSYAYGDSSADLQMLEAVGFPHVVNPDRSLAAVAKTRGWPILRWTLPVRRKGPIQ